MNPDPSAVRVFSEDLAKGLIRNTTITHLDMSGNHIRAAGTKATELHGACYATCAFVFPDDATNVSLYADQYVNGRMLEF